MLAYRKNVYSQNGEDGILEELLNRLPDVSGWVCEFGACNGKRLSNTFRLVKEEDYNAVYIECDPATAGELLETAREYPRITPLIHKVMPSGESSLDELLSTTDIPIDFDVLSIDIDSYDYQVWEGVTVYTPKLVVIEINSDAPNPWDLNHIHNGTTYQGTAFLPMALLGALKGYTLLCHTGNMIFARNDLVEFVGAPTTDLRSLFLKEYHFI
jgi:hypothetical protein